jgi:hypothetical protein
MKLKTAAGKCLICGDHLIDVHRESSVTVYTRSGTFTAEHLEFRCVNTKCRSGHRYGYHTRDKEIFYTDPLSQEYLIVSQNTAFQVIMNQFMQLTFHITSLHFPGFIFV